MNEALRQLLACKNMGVLRFDTHFSILETDSNASNIMKSAGRASFESNILSAFPELVGNEPYIRDILNRKKGDFRLDFVNCSVESGKSHFLNLLVLPDEKLDHGFFFFFYVTAQARALR